MIPKQVLIVTLNPSEYAPLREQLESSLDCRVTIVNDFDTALDELLHHAYHCAFSDTHLGALSGLDLLTATNACHIPVAFILVDKLMNARTATWALRMGAIDYFHQPLNLEMILMRISSLLKPTSITEPDKLIELAKAEKTLHNREAWLNPRMRPAAFILHRPQYVKIEGLLQSLKASTGATFAGLVDAAHNIVSAAGDLVNTDLIKLKKVFQEDFGSFKLARVLNEHQFTHVYFEGERESIFITDFGHLHPVSLVVICSNDIKAGLVWLAAKRTAAEIELVLQAADKTICERVATPE